MKRFLLTLAAAAFVFMNVATAQTQTTTKTKSKGAMAGKTEMKSNAMRDGVMMQGGKIMMFQKGQATIMNQDMKLENGAIVMQDGTVKMADGTTSMLKNGDHIDMKGNIMHHHDKHGDMGHENMDSKSGKSKVKVYDDKTKIETGGKETKKKY